MNIPQLFSMRVVVVVRWTLNKYYILFTTHTTQYATSTDKLIAYRLLLRNRALPAPSTKQVRYRINYNYYSPTYLTLITYTDVLTRFKPYRPNDVSTGWYESNPPPRIPNFVHYIIICVYWMSVKIWYPALAKILDTLLHRPIINWLLFS